MFKRKYVKIRSERLLEKIEDFLKNQNAFSRLRPKELYALRYSFDSLKTNISNPRLIKRISISDIPSILEDCDLIICSDEGSCENIGSKLSAVCSKLDNRMIFLCHNSKKSSIITDIFVYEPCFKDSIFYISGSYGSYVEEMNSSGLISYCVQDGKIIKSSDLSYEKEFFAFTKLNIGRATITFHYIP